MSTDEIHKRHDVVEVLLRCVVARNKLAEGPLKGIPDVDTVIRK